MRIDVYEILSTNSLSGSRIIINDNFKILEEGLNSLFNNIDIDDDGNMTLNNIAGITTHKFEVTDGANKTSLIVDEHGHLLIKKVGTTNEMLDVNAILSSLEYYGPGSGSGTGSGSGSGNGSNSDSEN
jgi:hypothetical protein